MTTEIAKVVDANEQAAILDQFSPQVDRLIRKMKRISFNLRTLKHACATGFYDMWGLFKEKTPVGFVLTQVIQYPTMAKALWMTLIIGPALDREIFPKFQRFIEDYALSKGCEQITAFARPGWRNWYQTLGYKPSEVVVAKRIGEPSW